MLTCREFDDFVCEYLEGGLRLSTRLGFRLHLLLCPDCKRYLDSYECTVSAARSAYPEPDAPVGEDVPEELVSAVMRLRERS